MKPEILDKSNVNNGNLTKKLQNVQQRIEDKAAEIEKKDFIIKSGGGAVEITAKGSKQLVSIKISDEVLSEKDVKVLAENLQDLIISAVNELVDKIDKYTNEEIEKITKGLPIPGLGIENK